MLDADLNYTALRFGLDVLQVIATLLVAVYVWWTSRSRATREAIEAVSADVAKLERRLDHVESDIEHIPGRQDWQDLDNRLDTLNRQIGELAEGQKSTNRLLHVINEHLLRDKSA